MFFIFNLSVFLCQDDGTDGPVMTLRAALQAVEKQGLIEYSLGGHACSRPPAVQQGQCDDKFDIKPDPENELLWRPSAIQTKHLKAANLASHFPYQILTDSPLVIAPWITFLNYWVYRGNISGKKAMVLMKNGAVTG